MADAARIVLTEGAAVVGVTAIASLHAGNGVPAPKVFIAGAAAYGALILLAGPAPKLAIGLGALGVVYGLLRSTGKGPSVGESILGLLGGGGGTGAFPAAGSAGQSADAATLAAYRQALQNPSQPTALVTGPAVAAGPLQPAPGGSGAVSWALSHLGIPYSFGGGSDSGPTKGIQQGANTVGFDCSAFVKAAWASVGVKLPRTTEAQQNVGAAVPSLQMAQPGDLLFPTASCPGGRCEHVLLYIGGGKAAEAPHTGDVTKIVDVSKMSFYTIRRP